ncbi:hypothetical protein BCR34DRAFT_477610 [Clohesyomyces aquaticus]|uniref:Zn(2)-C6 fungal-type domain-containing protein n=1 Tax=Clohesyomyces aquaticus TaxID=1231657 RepID=A0A1Y1ZZF2_9PLEO|nr:hypothetical protein BCR34DRAFT_477610 [Clohesyomyces aquaticus]
MVGVPGKSKGCITCRKRRVKCDEGKPTCNRCEKSGYECAGYNTGIHFINTSTAPFQDNQPNKTIQYADKVPVNIAPRIRPVVTIVPPELSLVAFQSDVCMSHLFSNFVWRTYGYGWLDLGAEGKLDVMTHQSVKALSSSFFGVLYRQEEIQLKGSMQYGKVLTMLRPRLSDPRKSGVENLIVPIMVLLMHASYEEDKSASIAHVKGLLMLLQVCGPAKFQNLPLRSAFESARATLVTAFLIARQPLFLDQQSWKVVPWALDPASKNSQNQLVDILVDVPGFLATDSNLQKSSTPDHTAISKHLLHMKSRLYALYIWRYKWALSNPSAAFETLPRPTRTSSSPRPIPKTLHFSTHEQAAEIMLYNAIHMWLLSLLFRLEPYDTTAPNATILTTALTAATFVNYPIPANNSQTLFPPILTLPHDPPSLKTYALEIVRTFEFQMATPHLIRSSSLFFLFPVGMAWPVLEKEEGCAEWIKGLLDKSEVTRGYAVGRNVWFSNYYLPKVMAGKTEREVGEGVQAERLVS